MGHPLATRAAPAAGRRRETDQHEKFQRNAPSVAAGCLVPSHRVGRMSCIPDRCRTGGASRPGAFPASSWPCTSRPHRAAGPRLNPSSAVTLTGLDDAVAPDELLGKGRAGRLTGVPIAHKDIFCTTAFLTTSRQVCRTFVAPYDGVVERWRAGHRAARQDNMDEFAWLVEETSSSAR